MIPWRTCEIHGEVERGGICGSCAVEHAQRSAQRLERINARSRSAVMATCNSCRFYRATPGACHRYPPTVVYQPATDGYEYENARKGHTEHAEGHSSEALTFWPEVDPDQWCGEWQGVLAPPRGGQ
jgi:hypothetical protein